MVVAFDNFLFGAVCRVFFPAFWSGKTSGLVTRMGPGLCADAHGEFYDHFYFRALDWASCHKGLQDFAPFEGIVGAQWSADEVQGKPGYYA